MQAGFIGDCLLQKRLKSAEDSQITGIRKAWLEGNSQIGTVAWSIRERFNLEADAGSGQFSWKWKEHGDMVSGETDRGFVWNGSARVVILEAKDTSLAAVGQAGGWDWFTSTVRFNGKAEDDKAKCKLRFWQAGAALSQKIGFFAPYLGWIVNQTKFKISRLSGSSARLESRVVSGPFLGCTLSKGSRLFLNIEWRGWFEEGLSVSGQIRF